MKWFRTRSHKDGSRPRRRGYARPRLEGLEDRTLPNATPLNVAQLIVNSAENETNFVTQQFQTFLRRAPDQTGLNGFVQALQNGASPEQVEASIASSAEYLAGHGGTAGTPWLTALYQDFLGRTPAQSELDTWTNALGVGASPAQVALSFATSTEREGDVITADYQRFLGRTPAPSEVSLWENALRNGLNQAGLEADIVGSQEFFTRAGGTNEDFVTAAYQAILGRTPSLSETQPWIDFLNGSSANQLITLHLKPLDLRLLGLEVQTNDITVTVSAQSGSGDLLGNVLTLASNLIDLQKASDALNQVLGTAVDLLNSGSLGINLGGGSFDTRPVATTDVLTLHVAPVHLNLLGALVNTSPVDVSITAHSGPGLVLGNIVTDLANLFNDLPGQPLNIDTLNQKLGNLLGLVNNALGSIPSATVPTVQPQQGQILNLTVPALDLNLLGLKLDTTPITVNADAVTGSGNLLGNVLTSLLNTLDATPDKVAQLNNTLNGVLARVVGVLNASSLVVSPALVSALPPALQTLLNPVLVAPAGSTAPVLDLIIASQDGTSPPVDVNLLGLKVTTSDIDAHLSAVTGNGQILGNLLYNVANLANPGGASGLLALLNALGAGNLSSTAGSGGGTLTGTTPAPRQLLQIKLNPIDLNLLGLEVKADGSQPGATTPAPIIVTLSAQGGDAKLLGNLLGAISTLVNLPAVESALNNALGTVVNLVNSVQLSLPPGTVGSGTFDTGTPADTPVLDAFVAPVHVDLLGLLVDTSPIHVTITAHAGAGLVLGNVVTDLAHLFDNPPATLTVDDVNNRLAQLLAELNAQIPGITPAPTPPVNLGPNQFLELTVPPIDLNLLGLLVKTSPITVNAFDQTGNGNLLGNFLSSLLTTIDATPGNLTVLSQNLDALLAKVVGVLNAADLTLPQAAISALPAVVQTLLSPVLISPTPGATAPVLDLRIASPDGTAPVRADLLGLVVTTSDIQARLLARTGDGQVLGNLLYNTAHLLDSGNALSLLFLLTELAGL